MNWADAQLLDVHCNLVIKNGMKELEYERLIEQADILFDQEDDE